MGIRRQNLISYSESFVNGVGWTVQAGVAITNNSIVAPDGTTTGALVDCTAAAAGSGLFVQTSGVETPSPNHKTYAFSFWAKAPLGTSATIAVVDPVGGGNIQNSGNKALTDQWTRITLHYRPVGANNSIGMWIQKVAGSNVFHLWGVQCVEANWAGPYKRVSGTPFNKGRIRSMAPTGENLLYSSEQVGNGNWAFNGVGEVVTLNAVTNPFGTATNASLIDLTAYTPGLDTGMYQMAVPERVFKGKKYTSSMWVRSFGGELRVELVSADRTLIKQWTVTDSAWTRIDSHAETAQENGAFRATFYLRLVVGTTSKKFYAWGGQIAEANWAGPYVKTDGANLVNNGRIRDRTTPARGAVLQSGQNLLLQSEGMLQAQWLKTNVTVADVTTETLPPPGVTTVQKLVEGAAANSFFRTVYSPIPASQPLLLGRTVTFSCYLKAGTRSWGMLLIGYSALFPQAYFDLTNGVVGSAFRCKARMVPVGNGWYRCSITTFITSEPTNFQVWISPTDQGDTTPLMSGVDGTTGIYAGGAQLEEGSGAAAYVKTVASIVNNGRNRAPIAPPQNLQLRSEEFDHAIWNKSTCTVTPNAVAGPFTSALVADAFVDNAVNGLHLVSSGGGGQEIAGNTYTLSFFMKAGTRSWALLAACAGAVYVNINLADGSFGSVSSSGGAVAIAYDSADIGNGWYRFWLAYISNGTTDRRLYSSIANNGFVYAGDTTAVMYMWGAQTNEGVSPAGYVKTDSVVLDGGRPRLVA